MFGTSLVVERWSHRCKLQICIVIGHMVKHVGHGNHHRWVWSLFLLLLVLLLVLVFTTLLFVWLLETTERRIWVNSRRDVKSVKTLDVLAGRPPTCRP